jgi:PAS domain S-box-containing protein
MDGKLLKQLNILNETALESMSISSEKEIAKRFIKAAITVLKADYGYAFFKDMINGGIKVLYKDPRTPFNPKTPRKRGATQKAFASRKPLYIASAPSVTWIRHDAKQHMKGVAVIPITFKNKNYGTFDICYHSEHVFTKTEHVLSQYIGNSAGQAITIARLYNRQKQFNKELEFKIQESTQQLREDYAKDEALLTSIGEGIVATDTDTKIILVNPAAETLLGINKQESAGKMLTEISRLYDESGKEVKQEDRPLVKALKARHRIKSMDFYLKNNKGAKIPVSINASPIILKGRLMGAILVIHDIIAEKEMDKAKSELISLASHQLRTPLSAVNWYTEALIKEELGKVTPLQKKYLKQIASANHKMIELVYDFLNVSRIELGTFQIQLSKFDITEMAKSIFYELKPAAASKKLKIEEIYAHCTKWVEADKKILRLILQNLLSNAVKYTPSGGKVRLEISMDTSNRKPRLFIKVEDTGYGIPPQQHNRVFSKLFRADNVASLQTEGTGLGLYIVKSFVDLCKGKIKFASALNKGTKFFVQLPVQDYEAAK